MGYGVCIEDVVDSAAGVVSPLRIVRDVIGRVGCQPREVEPVATCYRMDLPIYFDYRGRSSIGSGPLDVSFGGGDVLNVQIDCWPKRLSGIARVKLPKIVHLDIQRTT